MKKVFILVTVIFLVSLIGLQIYVFLHKPTSVEDLNEKAAELPELDLIAAEGYTYRLEKGRTIILMYFNSQCDHCQRQLMVMRENIKLFSSASIIFVSAQERDEVSRVAGIFDFYAFPNVRFVAARPEQLSEKFGVLSLPQIFVYSKYGKLLKVFTGQTKPEDIVAVLPD
jgi:thioredoxin-related protein